MPPNSEKRRDVPRYATVRTDRPTHGPALRETAALLGTDFMPWQSDVSDVALEHADGRMAYRDVAVTVPRQSGKTTIMLALIVHRLIAAPDQAVLYGAQTRIAARGKLFDVLWPRVRRSPLGPMFKLERAMGYETLRCSNGSTLRLLSSEESAGHGDTLDLVVLDECWSMGPSTEQGVRPAMVTRKNAQLWMLSTAGTDKSVWWRSKVEAGRLSAQTGGDKGLAYFEWSAGEDLAVMDSASWPLFMPALGHTIDESVVEADLAVMAPAEWRRAYANQWPDESAEGWTVIPQDVWGASAL